MHIWDGGKLYLLLFSYIATNRSHLCYQRHSTSSSVEPRAYTLSHRCILQSFLSEESLRSADPYIYIYIYIYIDQWFHSFVLATQRGLRELLKNSPPRTTKTTNQNKYIYQPHSSVTDTKRSLLSLWSMMLVVWWCSGYRWVIMANIEEMGPVDVPIR